MTGGFVYRGLKYPRLRGVYFYGDFCTGGIHAATRNGQGWSSEELLQSGLGISTFGEDEMGELYVADFFRGDIYRIKDARCNLDIELSYQSGTLTMDFALGLASPATWNVWLASVFGLHPAWSTTVPAIDPPATPSIPIPVPPIGSVLGLTTLSTPVAGSLCVDFDLIDTGAGAPKACAIWCGKRCLTSFRDALSPRILTADGA